MDNDRIRELQALSNEFLRKLGEEDDEEILLKQSINTESNENAKNNIEKRKLNMPDFSLSRLYKRKLDHKISLVNNY